jgi:hypothetical protein
MVKRNEKHNQARKHFRAIGIVENMSGFVCSDCGAHVNIFKTGGGKKIAEDLSFPSLGSISIDLNVCGCADNRLPFNAESKPSPAASAFADIVRKIDLFLERGKQAARAIILKNQDHERR